MIYDTIYLLTAIGLTTGGSSKVVCTFTNKQYRKQHNETEYPEQNIHNNKKTKTNKRIHNIIIRIHNLQN